MREEQLRDVAQRIGTSRVRRDLQWSFRLGSIRSWRGELPRPG
jgi:hypothetical protein